MDRIVILNVLEKVIIVHRLCNCLTNASDLHRKFKQYLKSAENRTSYNIYGNFYIFADRIKMSKRFSLVMDLDETFISTRNTYTREEARDRGVDGFMIDTNLFVAVRPGFYDFMKEMYKLFDDFYVFTAAAESYAMDIVNKIFSDTSIVKCWTRDSCTLKDGEIYKIISGMTTPDGKCLDNERTMMIDDRPSVTHMNVHTREQNHIVIRPFDGNPHDRALVTTIENIRTWKAQWIK